MAFPLRRKLAFAAFTQLALFGGLEIALRAGGFHARRRPVEFVGANLGNETFPRIWDDDVFWRMQPGASVPGTKTERINDRGFRGPDIADAKPPNVRRVVCLGDSCTFGSMVEGDATFSRALERWLSAGGARAEVVNLGVPGYSAFQMWRQLVHVALPLAPDAVVVYAGAWNDFTPAVRYADPAIADRVDSAQATRAFGTLSVLRCFEACRALAAKTRPEPAPVAEAYAKGFALRGELPDGPRVPPDAFRATLAAISRDARAANAAVVFVVPPAPAATRAKFPDSETYARMVRDAARSARDRVADARATFARGGDADTTLFEDSIHPSQCGHSWIASSVATELLALGWPELRGRTTEGVAEPLPLDLSASMQLLGGKGSPERIPAHASVAAPTPATFSSDVVVVPPRSSIRVAYGWVGAKSDKPVRFRVAVEHDGATDSLFEDGLSSPADTEADIARKTIDLSAYEGRSVRFLFSATGSAAVAYWIRPKVGRFPPG
ncbi:MAG TPA: SGNH/GDSL hydrolase family protein [Planctomycetota bacterium]|nr:SGNH/GDSL hydrolase family protein [Planctomycetota bacterium]